ncbi:PhzF family phenazine biosynthesis protein [Cellulomonas marina]|uniref:Phenazine biosynthesis protein PhzF family n=1 Tax=Cellulomonas marina TaxID=988821 RepID=A0A1I0V2D5_9CELL|nr:PhzF family phenazine biosynthesis protein [Cellulomonas marina]GIG28271.1 phenazine biosynthesis protein PhzF [Cellulomonas marina]SFA70293.1 phenazine biosynthesis protein PhzF family [Cellulomonas marina]
MTTRRFAQVDVFSAEPLRGNPVAVVLDADGLDDAAMARFARWTNLSETTFVLPPTAAGAAAGADYRLRIFTPGGELPFAGHPTLGSAHAWREVGGVPRATTGPVQECAAGIVPLRTTGRRADEGADAGGDVGGHAGGDIGGEFRGDAGTLAFAAPPLLREGPLDDALLDRIVAGLGVGRDAVVDHAWADNGPGWAAVRLRTAAEVLALRPDMAALVGFEVGVVGVHAAGGPAHLEVRAFCPELGVPEDPVTGSLNAALAPWLVATGVVPPRYVAAQGTVLDRAGRVHVEVGADGTWVGGACRTVIRGTVDL